MTPHLPLFLALLSVVPLARSAPPPNDLIAVDQFGYRTGAQKHAMLCDPQTGFNSGLSFNPGSQFEIKRADNDQTVFVGNLVAYNGGATDSQFSGDRVWTATFSGLTNPGSYYVWEPNSGRASYVFKIDDNQYREILKHAVRTFFYQRCNFTKSSTHAGIWNHSASHPTDANAPLWRDGANRGQNRDVSGGWYDAGDYHKYVPWTANTVWELLMSYELNPSVFADNWNIPESNNGVPDILDEIKFELDWVMRMQLSNGSFATRVGALNYPPAGPPSNDTQQRYYTQGSTWATGAACAILAHASRVFANYESQFPGYANQLRTAAENGWTYLENTPNMTPGNGQDGGNGSIVSGEPNSNANQDRRLRVFAAAELFRTTGTAKYKTFFDNLHRNDGQVSDNGHHPLIDNRFDAGYALELNQAYYIYATTPGATQSIVDEIRADLKQTFDETLLPNNTNNQWGDPFKAFIWPGQHSWSSNRLKALHAQIAIMGHVLQVEANAVFRKRYLEIAEEYIHYFHGRNPISQTYLSNMGPKGANLFVGKSLMEPAMIGFHERFSDE